MKLPEFGTTPEEEIMKIQDRLKQQSDILENENYHTAAQATRDAIKALDEAEFLLLEARKNLLAGNKPL